MTTKTAHRIMAGVLLLCLALLGLWLFFRQKAASQTTAAIFYQGKEIRRVDLSTVTETEEFTVGSEDAWNIIQISPEGICIRSANCPDQICVHQGVRAHGPEPIVCLPHKLSIRFLESGQGDASLDAVTGR